jgi:hypothetical protein
VLAVETNGACISKKARGRLLWAESAVGWSQIPREGKPLHPKVISTLPLGESKEGYEKAKRNIFFCFLFHFSFVLL